MFDLAQHIGGLKKKTADEYAGPCPWCGGTDRFLVWPSDGDTGGFWCRRCGRKGDGIDYLRDAEDLSFQEACEVAHCEWAGMVPRHSRHELRNRLNLLAKV